MLRHVEVSVGVFEEAAEIVGGVEVVADGAAAAAAAAVGKDDKVVVGFEPGYDAADGGERMREAVARELRESEEGLQSDERGVAAGAECVGDAGDDEGDAEDGGERKTRMRVVVELRVEAEGHLVVRKNFDDGSRIQVTRESYSKAAEAAAAHVPTKSLRSWTREGVC